mgnify:CR=1 FL=1
MSLTSKFFKETIALIRKIPIGKVATYGQIAKLAGEPRSARQVARFLHSSSRKYKLPWHRVINSQGKLSLPDPGLSQQRRLLMREGVEVTLGNRVSLQKFQWQK